jgi:hypothetical protein
LLLDGFNQAFARFLAMDRQDRLAAAVVELQMRTLLRVIIYLSHKAQKGENVYDSF